MGMPNFEMMEFPSNDGLSAIVGTGKEINASDLVAGYDFTRGGTAAFTAVLEGSVAGSNWTTIATLNASAQGEIPAYYNRVRINVSVAGLIGATELKYLGKS